MWKQLCVLTLVFFAPGLSKNVLDVILERLNLNLDYILNHYSAINKDCLFGVVLAQGIIDDLLESGTAFRPELGILKKKLQEIYKKTILVINRDPSWELFGKSIVDPKLWTKKFSYKPRQFLKLQPQKQSLQDLFSADDSENYTESFSDYCLTLIVNNTLLVKTTTKCKLNTACKHFLERMDIGSGYILTHKLLLLQIAKVRKCDLNAQHLSTAFRYLCSRIYTELISVEYFMDLGETFDLFLEQSVLCGYEGFSDFFQKKWLSRILEAQSPTGCFPLKIAHKRKREANEWKDGCADHSTGLGTAVLSLYLNYFLKIN